MGGFSPRLATPRVPIVPESERTPEQLKVIDGRALNIYYTLAHNPPLYLRWRPLGSYLLNRSSLPARHRELLMLRMGWLCQSPYEWAQHTRIAMAPNIGITAAEIRRIAEGPAAAGWTPFEAALLTAVDELRYDSKISDKTWATLKTQYSDNEILEAIYTASQYQLVSMALNSAGIQIEPENSHRLPTGLPLPPVAQRVTSPRLTTPRVAPLKVADLTPEQREIAKGQISADGKMAGLYATLITHPTLYGPRTTFGTYLQRESMLSPRQRELLIMRTAYQINSPYEWSHHVPLAKQAGMTDAEIARIIDGPDAPGWTSEEAALLRAVDELRREAFVTDQTWAVLTKTFNTQQMFEIVYTTGGYSMTGFVINSLGIQVEPGYPKAPF